MYNIFAIHDAIWKIALRYGKTPYLIFYEPEVHMGFIELILIAIGLSMDAFAVSICTGLTIQRLSLRQPRVVGLYFGVFQMLMPLIGYLVGSTFASYIIDIDHWIAFVLLAFIGARMVKESLSKEEEAATCEASLGVKRMLPLAVATSIDALAIGVSFAFLNVDIIPATSLIGATTLGLSMSGVWLGNIFGARYKSKAEFVGGAILILLGLKILLEHLGVF
jgi:putative Mn2+ efflux pump MntP